MATAEGELQPLSEKELLNLRKQQLLRLQFMQYLLKQVAEVTYQYNCFEHSSLSAFITVPAVSHALLFAASVTYLLCL